MERSASLVLVVVAAIAAVGIAVPAEAATKSVPKFRNCTAMNKVYVHGVGRRGAKDKVAKGGRPVTTFLVNDRGYKLNYRLLDRDRDGIACERL